MSSEQKYIKDLTEIRQMMERSSRFMSLTGWSGIMAGIYALAGAFVAYQLYYSESQGFIISDNLIQITLLALLVLSLAVGTAIFLSFKKARKIQEPIWNASSRRLIVNMAIPLFSGGILILVLISIGMAQLAVPFTLIFYGLSLVNASIFSFDDIKYLGLSEILLGLISTYYIHHSLLLWAIGFGILHIIYGIYMHWRYEK